MFGLGPTELIIILVIVIILFGVGRLSKIGGELGGGIRAFRESLSSEDDEGKKDDEAQEEGHGEAVNKSYHLHPQSAGARSRPCGAVPEVCLEHG